MASGIAHEINTPTQYIGDNMRFLKESFSDMVDVLEKYDDLLDEIEIIDSLKERVSEMRSLNKQADIEYLVDEVPMAIEQSLEGYRRVAEIVLAMKEFAYPGIEDMIFVNINKAIESTIAVAKNEWKYVADVVAELSNDMPQIVCLPGAFNQVVLNLLVNAAHSIGDQKSKSPGQKGEIRISTRLDDDWLEVRISDTGMGIPEKIRQRVFDPFFTTKDIGKGTGHGLAAAHSVIVERHNGTIRFETKIGKGTTFIIRIPAQTAEEEVMQFSAE